MPENAGTTWQLSVLLAGDVASDLRGLGEFNQRYGAKGAGGAAQLLGDTVEAKAESAESIGRLLALVPRGLTAYVEVPVEPDPAPLLAAIARGGGRAKVRTGGVTDEVFPIAGDLLRFLAACAATGLPFKATAGLHHPIRATYRLTYAPNSAQGMMYGYLNVLLAAAFLQAGLALDEALDVLQERDVAAFQFGDQGLAWRSHQLGNAQIAQARRLAIAFGSCSFREPVDELEGLGLL